jgi:DNA polymerase-3 subunit delta
VVAVKAGNAERFLADPPATLRTLLLFGTDAGLIAERAAAFIQSTLGPGTDPLSVARLDADTLANDPGRLADEANAQSLFTGQRVVHVRAMGARSIVPALEPVLATPPIDTRIVIEAGDLKKSAALRQRCEAAKSAAAVACFADDERTLDRLIDDELRAANITIAPDARAALRLVIGGDRMASRAEIRKLTLFASGQDRIRLADVKAIVGDSADMETDDLLDAIATGDVEAADRTMRRLLASGASASSIGTAIQRHFQLLHRLKASVATGMSFDRASETVFPRLFGPHRDATEEATRMWSQAALDRALERIERTMVEGRLNGPIVSTIIADLAGALALRASSGGRKTRRDPAPQGI